MAAYTGTLPPTLDPLSDLLDHQISPPDFVVRPFLPRGELTEVVGAHGTGKSTLLLGACLAVATGRPWCGVPTVQGRAVFITLEDSRSTLARRARVELDGIMDAIEDDSERSAAEQAARSHFAFLSRERSRSLILTSTRDGITEVRDDVVDHLAGLTAGAALVILETGSRIHCGPETNDALATLALALERIAVSGPAVVVVRHVSKKAAREGTTDSYAGRGGSAFSDAVRSSLVVKRDPNDSLGRVTLTAAKTTHAKPGEILTWQPVPVEHLGTVRMVPMDRGISATADAQALLAYIDLQDRGVVRSRLHKCPPEGLGRARTLAALSLLLAWGSVVTKVEERGKNKQRTEVYYTVHQALGCP